MYEPKTLKGHLMRAAAAIAVAGPWRDAVERGMKRIGHRFPGNRLVEIACRHLGTRLISREGPRYRRMITFDSGGQMPCGGNDSVALASTMYYFLGTINGQNEDERPVLKLLKRAVKSGYTCFDVGANLGFYSFFLGPLCGRSGSVHAFEANPLLIEHLRNGADLNKNRANIVVNAVAVGQKANTTLQLYDPDRIGGSSIYKLDWLDASKSVSVPMTTIDEYIRSCKIDRVDVIKIDIEGAEVDAFLGMKDTFNAFTPKLIVCELALFIEPNVVDSEAAPVGRGRGAFARQIIALLRSKGYQPHYADRADGRLGDVVDEEALGASRHILVNVAFAHASLRDERPDLFRF